MFHECRVGIFRVSCTRSLGAINSGRIGMCVCWQTFFTRCEETRLLLTVTWQFSVLLPWAKRAFCDSSGFTIVNVWANLLSHPSPRVSFMMKLEWQCVLKAFENMWGNILKLQPLISYFVTNAFWELHTMNFQTLFFSRDRRISGILKYLCLFVSCKESEELFLFLKQTNSLYW